MERMKFFLAAVFILTFPQVALTQKSQVSIFLPGIVSIEGNDFSSCFSKDGKAFYFSRTINTKSQLHTTRFINGSWSAPERLPFCNEQFSYADPAFSPDGELYFISDMPVSASDTTRDYDIWKTSFHNGRWTDPVNVNALNSPDNEYYISFTSKGDVYFSSSREGGFGEEDIYTARRKRKEFDSPVNLGSTMNTIHSEYDPFIRESEDILIFASSGRKDSFGKADLYWTKKGKEWGEVNHFGTEINSPNRDYCPYIARDGSFFFSSDGQVKVIDKLFLAGL